MSKYLSKDIFLDVKQEEILKIIETYREKIAHKSLFGFFKSKKNTKSGIYIYGDVGRGKTMICRAFFDSLDIPKQYFHYQEFMMNIHKALKQNDSLNSRESAKMMVDLSLKQYRILFIDEFEIKDMTDSLIMNNLFLELKKANLFVVITSNSSPDTLYSNGPLRERILPFINFLNKEFEILNLDSDIDYRAKYINDLKRVIYPFNEDNFKKKQIIFANLKITNLKEDEISIFGRKIKFNSVSDYILVTDFSEICERDFGYSDYVEICKKYKVVILSNVKKINNEASDILIRFVNLIDNIYFNNILLFIFLETEPELIYVGSNRKDDFKRCLSRLKEIDSNEYFNNSKYVQYKERN